MAKLVWLLPPTQGRYKSMRYHWWETKDGRYRVYRIVSRARESIEFEALSYQEEMDTYLPCHETQLTTLEASLDAILAYHAQQSNEEITDNRTEVLAQAAKQGLLDTSGPKTNPRKEKEGFDNFGSRAGSKLALVNAQLSLEPQSMKQLIDKAGVEQTCYNHLNHLVELGLVVKTPQGYALRS